MSVNMENVILAATKQIEESLDAEIEKLDKMEDEDLQALERKRYDQLKKQVKHKEELVASGHGVYTECFSERDFFDLGRKSKNIVCHFYRPSTMRCGIVDKHLTALAPKHIEAKFIKINAEKSPFLVQRLKVRVLPTIVVCKEEKFVDYIVGFDDLGGTDDFTTDAMARRLAQSGVINYKGEPKKANPFIRVKPKTIRGGGYDDSDSD